MCCFAFFRMPVGNLYESPLVKIWNSPRAIAKRSEMIHGPLFSPAVAPNFGAIGGMEKRAQRLPANPEGTPSRFSNKCTTTWPRQSRSRAHPQLPLGAWGRLDDSSKVENGAYLSLKHPS